MNTYVEGVHSIQILQEYEKEYFRIHIDGLPVFVVTQDNAESMPKF